MASTNSTQALQLLLGAAMARQDMMEEELGIANGQLNDILDKKKRRAKGGGKILQMEVQAVIERLTIDLASGRQNIEEKEGQLRELQAKLGSTSAKAPETVQSHPPSAAPVAANSEQQPTSNGVARVANPESDNMNGRGGSSGSEQGHGPANEANASTATNRADGGVVNDPEANPKEVPVANTLTGDTLSPPNSQGTPSPAVAVGTSLAGLGPGIPLQNAGTSQVTPNIARDNHPIASPVHQSINTAGSVLSDEPHLSDPSLPTPDFNKGANTVGLNEPSQNTTKPKVITYSQKRTAEAADDSAEREAKRQQLQGPVVSAGPPGVSNHATQMPQPKTSRDSLTQHTVDSESDEEWQASEDSEEQLGSSEYEGFDESSSGGVNGSEEDDTDEEGNINLTPRPGAADTHFDDDSFIPDDEAWQLKLVNSTDIRDLATRTIPDTSSDMAPIRSANGCPSRRRVASRQPATDAQPAAIKRVREPVKGSRESGEPPEGNKEDGGEEEGDDEEDDQEESEEEESEEEEPKKGKIKGKGKAAVVKSRTRSDKPDQGTERKSKLPPRERWDVMDEEEREAITDRCRLAIQEYLLNPTAKKRRVPNNLRNYIREVSELCPEASFASRELALHCLTTRYRNTLCLYHHSHDKAGKVNDDNPPSYHLVTGVPWVRDAKDRNPNTQPVVREDYVLHCGCHADDALWDFFWWKTGYIHSPTSDITEPWRFTHMEPRPRGLIVQFVQDLTHLNIDDVFSGTLDSRKTKLKLLRKMERSIHDAVTELESELQRSAIDFV